MDGKEIQIYAKGRYPVKAKTKVQDVAKYQNDGTTRGVTPAKFAEEAAAQNDNWSKIVSEAVDKAMFGTTLTANPFGKDERTKVNHMFLVWHIKEIGKRMASDISRACQRIKTGRLKSSFTFRLK